MQYSTGNPQLFGQNCIQLLSLNPGECLVISVGVLVTSDGVLVTSVGVLVTSEGGLITSVGDLLSVSVNKRVWKIFTTCVPHPN